MGEGERVVRVTGEARLEVRREMRLDMDNEGSEGVEQAVLGNNHAVLGVRSM